MVGPQPRCRHKTKYPHPPDAGPEIGPGEFPGPQRTNRLSPRLPNLAPSEAKLAEECICVKRAKTARHSRAPLDVTSRTRIRNAPERGCVRATGTSRSTLNQAKRQNFQAPFAGSSLDTPVQPVASLGFNPRYFRGVLPCYSGFLFLF
jgi:hypothetical protein